MAEKEESKESSRNCCNKVTDFIIGKFEAFFFGLGKGIGKSPFLTILVSLIVAGLCGIGMIKFEQENRGEKLWNPQDSEALRHKEIVDTRYPVASRINNALFEGSNVLTSQMMKAVLEFDKKVKNIYNGTDQKWEDICFRQGAICRTRTILEIWGYNETIINGLTDAQVLLDVNRTPLISPITQRTIVLESILGDTKRDSSSKIIGAKALLSSYFIKNQAVYDKSTGQNEDPKGKLWEEEFGKVCKNFDKQYSFFEMFFYSLTAFREASSSAISGDITFLSAGYFLIIGYLAIMLGKFSRIEQKAWLAVIGVLCVGLSILVCFGLSSAFGFFYGPVHSILPFLILGIGVDDIFVIIQSYENIAKELPDDCSVPYIVASTMKHAGVAISITSMTDIIAFLVGASTVLPALQSFCVYAGLGILAVFFFSCTIFTACLSLDIRRKDRNRDACCCCITLPDDYEPFACGKVDRLQMFFDNMIAKFIVKFPFKIGILVVTVGLLIAGSLGTANLTQNFDFNLFLPPDSDATKYNTKISEYFPNDGVNFAVYFGDMDYFKEQNALQASFDKIYGNEYVVKSSVSSWYDGFMKWVNTTHGTSGDVDQNKRPKTEALFYSWLQTFLADKSGRIYQTDVKFQTSGGSTKISYSRMHATHIKMTDSPTEVKAMDSVREDISSITFSKEAFPYSRFYIGWETNKIISVELVRNLALAAACVFLVTLFLLANIWTSLMVFTCVVLTLVDVCGMMYFWGLYIDTVTSVMLILAIGLCVDYAAHIGHAFMTTSLPTRNERAASAISEIGPAVLNGGISTFLAFVFLAGSTSYVFKTFFKVFFLVVIFGLFHGLLYFPTILSLLGPRAYSTPTQRTNSSENTKKSRSNSVSNDKTQHENVSNGHPASNGNAVIENVYINDKDGAANHGAIELQARESPDRQEAVQHS